MIASDQFRIGAWILGKQQKRLVCTIPTGFHKCSLTPLQSPKLENVFFLATLSCKKFWPDSRQHWVWMHFLLPKIRCWEEFWPDYTCLRALENHLGNPEASKIQTKNMKAWPDAWGKQQSRDNPINVSAMPTLPWLARSAKDLELAAQLWPLTCGQKEDAASLFVCIVWSMKYI